MEAKFSKNKQLAYKNKRKDIPKGAKTEAPVQSATNGILENMQIPFFRVPDRLWFWLKTKCPAWLLKDCSKHLAGWPDNMAFIPITNKYLLACPIECKSRTGKMQGKQKKLGTKLNYQIPRSSDDALEIITAFIKDAEIIREKILEKEI